MLIAEGTTIKMDEKNYGLGLPITILNYDKFIEPTDVVEFSIKKECFDDELLLKKTFTNLQTDESGNFVFTLDFNKKDAELLKPGTYIYFIDVFRDNVYLDTKIKNALFIVEDV